MGCLDFCKERAPPKAMRRATPLVDWETGIWNTAPVDSGRFLNEFLAEMRAEFPHFRLIPKAESRFQTPASLDAW